MYRTYKHIVMYVAIEEADLARDPYYPIEVSYQMRIGSCRISPKGILTYDSNLPPLINLNFHVKKGSVFYRLIDILHGMKPAIMTAHTTTYEICDHSILRPKKCSTRDHYLLLIRDQKRKSIL